ncbi:MAG: hypothetical protein JNJ54_34005 [Myxococcaceae bacterium]|nr:hypothetical protein [Myxococcaceae bacterium]
MTTRAPNESLRPVRALELRAREAVERAISREGCERVLVVYEKADPRSPGAPRARVYGEDDSGPRKLEVL